MEKREILDAQEKLLDSIDTFMKWFLSVAVIIWWAGLASDDKVVELLGLKVARIKLFPVAGAFFVLMNMVFWLYLRRISTIFRLADENDRASVLAGLVTHPWILNPFALYDVRKSGRTSYVNLTLLVLVWWFCNMSLYAIYPYFYLSQRLLLPWMGFFAVFLPFLFIGAASLQEITGIFGRLKPMADQSGNDFLKSQFAVLKKDYPVMAVIGIVVGAAITLAVLFDPGLYRKVAKKQPTGTPAATPAQSPQDTVSIARFMVPITADSIRKTETSKKSPVMNALFLLNKELSRLCFYNLLADTGVKIIPAVGGTNRAFSQAALSGVSAISSAGLSIIALNREALGSGNFASAVGSVGDINPVFISLSAGGALSSAGSVSAGSKEGDSTAFQRKQEILYDGQKIKTSCEAISNSFGDFFFLRKTVQVDLSDWMERNLNNYMRDQKPGEKRALAANDYMLAELLSLGQITEREAGIFSCLAHRAVSEGHPASATADQLQKTLAVAKALRAQLEQRLLQVIAHQSLGNEDINRMVAELEKSAQTISDAIRFKP